MQIVNRELFDLNGNPIKSGDIDMTVAVVLVNCALAPTPDGKSRSESDVASRWELALRVNKTAVGESFDVAPELIVKLKEDVLRVYTTIIAGQMLPILNGNAVH